jgi:dipeptidyl aminopeptidase/acylaminoacyl peptidase
MRIGVPGILLCAACLTLPLTVNAATLGRYSLEQVLHYPYDSQLAGAQDADIIAWVRNTDGVRNVWVARGPAFVPLQITRYAEDDGQEITQLTFSPDGAHLAYVRGGDHDSNWPAEGNLSPDPAASVEQPTTAVWTVPTVGGEPLKIDEGDAPVISTRGGLAYIKEEHVWLAGLNGGKPERLFFDRGKDSDLRWSPDGSRLAFVSDRGNHSFIGIYAGKNLPLMYVAPSTGRDRSPRWSPDGMRIAFVRLRGDGGAPDPILTQMPNPWSIWVGSTADGSARSAWHSPETLAGSFPDVEGEANLHWASGDRLVFLAYLDEWQHLYSVPAGGGTATLLTPGDFMVEHVVATRDGRYMIYDANSGTAPGDADRRHLFSVPTDRPGATPLTSGESLEWTPVTAARDVVAYVSSGPRQPPSIATVDFGVPHRATSLAGTLPADFPLSRLITPRPVSFLAADGTRVHGQLFASENTLHTAAKPGVIFVHGGPPRQMLLGWHYMDYYSNAYAVNQYLASRGFVVLALNYRLGIGYGRAFHQPDHAGLAGASEYQDVVAGGRFLQELRGVDPSRIGIWGGSYGGYLTALALARNSDIFKAGVDLHGVHDWSRLIDEWTGKPMTRYEQGDREKAIEVAWKSSPVSALEDWRSPVLLIHGDDDRNVPFVQTVDLARRLTDRKVPFEELIIPNEIHGFLRHDSWLRVDQATVAFLARNLRVSGE